MRFVRSFAAVALALAVLAPGLGPLVAVTGEAEDDCAGHVCQCARRCPPKRTNASSCHGNDDARSACEMRGACRHDQAAAPLGGLAWAGPEPVAAAPVLDAAPLRHAFVRSVSLGFSRIDPRPPRKA